MTFGEMISTSRQRITFDCLNDVSRLMNHLFRITLCFHSGIISEDLAITLKNLVIDKYIMDLDANSTQYLESKKSQFKDWLSERIIFQCSNKQSFGNSENASTGNSDEKLNFNRQNSNIEKRIEQPECNMESCNTMVIDSNPAIKRRYIYCTEIDSFHVTSSTLQFETAAALFNNTYQCTVRSNCKIVRRERSRKNKDTSTQLYKCNCYTTEIVLQFRHYHSETTDVPNIQTYRIGVFIKKQSIPLFNSHFIIKK
jgi:hypothetical protein